MYIDHISVDSDYELMDKNLLGNLIYDRNTVIRHDRCDQHEDLHV